jgi:hypothetical protein
MADVTLTITLPDIQAHALAIVAASIGPEQFDINIRSAIGRLLDRAPRMAARSGRWIRPSLIADSVRG